jgi:hypothetical protein
MKFIHEQKNSNSESKQQHRDESKSEFTFEQVHELTNISMKWISTNDIEHYKIKCIVLPLIMWFSHLATTDILYTVIQLNLMRSFIHH